MPESTNDRSSVDGFADTNRDADAPETPDSPDYGTQGRAKPLTEEERMQAEREIKEQGNHNRVRDRQRKE